MLLSARQCGLRPAPLPVQARFWLSCITSLRTCHTPVLPFHGEIGPAVPGRSEMASCRVETDPIGHEEHVQHLDTRSRRLARHLENHAWHLSEGNGSVQGGGVSLTMRRAFGLAWKIGAGKRGNQAQQGVATHRGPSTHLTRSEVLSVQAHKIYPGRQRPYDDGPFLPFPTRPMHVPRPCVRLKVALERPRWRGRARHASFQQFGQSLWSVFC